MRRDGNLGVSRQDAALAQFHRSTADCQRLHARHRTGDAVQGTGARQREPAVADDRAGQGQARSIALHGAVHAAGHRQGVAVQVHVRLRTVRHVHGVDLGIVRKRQSRRRIGQDDLGHAEPGCRTQRLGKIQRRTRTDRQRRRAVQPELRSGDAQRAAARHRQRVGRPVDVVRHVDGIDERRARRQRERRIEHLRIATRKRDGPLTLAHLDARQLDGAEVVVERRPVRNLGKVDRAARAREGRRAAAFPIGTRAKVVVRPTDPLEIGCTDALGKQQAEDNSSSRHRRANMSQHYLIFVE